VGVGVFGTEGGDEDEGEEEWAGFGEREREAEYEDERQLATVTVVEDFDPTALIYEDPAKNVGGDEAEGDVRPVREKGRDKGKGRQERRVNAGGVPAQEGDRGEGGGAARNVRERPKKVKYGTRAGRKAERTKQRTRKHEKAERAGRSTKARHKVKAGGSRRR